MKAWYDCGWDPRVLTERDARALPQYDELLSHISDPTLIDDKALSNYKRWMAMTVVGGGWMADINTWPLNYFLRHGRVLPHDGMLTIYQGPQPSLVSGIGSEYFRIAQQIGNHAEKTIGKQKMINENFPEKAQKKMLWVMQSL